MSLAFRGDILILGNCFACIPLGMCTIFLDPKRNPKFWHHSSECLMSNACVFVLCVEAAAFLFVLMGPAQKTALLRAEVDFGDFSPIHPLWVVSTFTPFLVASKKS